MRSTVERELKLVPGEGFRIGELGRELPRRTFTSTYHDTPSLRLARHGITLRHRVEDGAGLWQLKLPRGVARLELELAGPPARLPDELRRLLAAYLRGDDVVRVARMRTQRKRARVDGAELVEDSVAVFEGPRVVERFHEIEIELTGGDEEALSELERRLVEAGAETAAFAPKLYRVLGLEYPPPSLAAPRDGTPLDAVRVALLRQYERLLAHDPGTRLGTDPEDLHQMRVATRRARAFLRAARPLLDREWAGSLRDELGWLGAALGPARDLDVLLEHIRDDLHAIGVDESAAGSLVRALEDEHAEARQAAVAALDDPRYLALLDRLEHVEPEGDPSAAATLGDLWWDELRRTRKRFSRLGPSSSDDELHAARIQAKRARYAAELAEPELGKPGRRFVEAAKELQDVLGEHQDACVAEERIRAWAGRVPEADRVAARLLQHEERRRLQAREAWPAAWSEVERRARKARP